MDNATRRQLLEQAKQIGYTGNILDVFQNPQILDQFVQEQQQVQQQQFQQQSQPQMQVEMPTPPAVVPNYKVPQPRQSEAQPLVMSNTEVPMQLRRTGGILYKNGGPKDPPKKTTYTPPMPSIVEPAVSTNVFVPNPQFNNLSLNAINETIPAEPVNEYFPTDAYISELRNQENAGKTGFKNNKFYSYPSVEGGTPTIAYGHKLTKDEVKKGTYNKGLTEDEATKLMMEDLAKNVTKARDSFNAKYGQGRFDLLPTELKDLVVDYSYTGTGVDKFPSFHGAINNYISATTSQEKAKAKQKMLAEYKRHTDGKELTNRNKFSEKTINSLNTYQYGGKKCYTCNSSKMKVLYNKANYKK